MNKLKWLDSNIHEVTLAITNKCNAGCPQCHRTNPDGLKPVHWLPDQDWTLEQFKNAFPLEDLRKIDYLQFCGTWGDPVMNKDIFEMCEWIKSSATDEQDCPTINIVTNGSMRDPDWWWELGATIGKKLEVHFAVDGITEEMHQKYRRRASLKRVLDNMEAIGNTMARVHAQTIVFKHNEEYMDEIHDLCKTHGAISTTFITSDRFKMDSTQQFGNMGNGDRFKFVNAEGETEWLERSYVNGKRTVVRS